MLGGGRTQKSSSARDELYTRGATLVGQIHCPSHSRARPDAEAMPLPDNGGFRLGLLGGGQGDNPACAGRLACDSGAHSSHSSRGACTIPHSLWEGSAATIFPLNVFMPAHDSAVKRSRYLAKGITRTETVVNGHFWSFLASTGTRQAYAGCLTCLAPTSHARVPAPSIAARHALSESLMYCPDSRLMPGLAGLEWGYPGLGRE